MANAQTLEDRSPGLVKGVARAQRAPAGRCHALAHLIDVPALTRAYRRQRSAAAVGVEGITKEQYGQDLEANLEDLHGRLKGKRYRHQPIRRVHIPTAQGKTRPIGLSVCEDKLVQDAVREVLEAIYEQDFRECSYGFRPGRSAHDAVRPLQRIVDQGEVQWIFEADIVSCFDRVDRTELKKMLAVRVADGSLLRLIGKCVHVGGLDGETMVEPELGTAQGAVLSPWLGNVSLHSVLDRWCATEVQPRLQGKAPLMRSCDDCLIGFERKDDARRVQAVLDTRLGRYGLPLHPEKTRLLPLWCPPQVQPRGKGPATCALLGFTRYWRRTRHGHWRMGCKTRRASLRRAKTSLDDWCRRHRHLSIEEQHAALTRRLRGHCNSFGVSGNYGSVMRLVEATQRAWDTWRRRRSHRTRLNWERCTDMLRWWPLPRPRITVRIWDGSSRVTPTEAPEGGQLLVRIWRGAGTGNRPAYSTTAL
jgi:RNA-directed DNA polymerase